MKDESFVSMQNVHLNHEMSQIYTKVLGAILQMTENKTLTRDELYKMLVGIAVEIQERIGETVIISPYVEDEKHGHPIAP